MVRWGVWNEVQGGNGGKAKGGEEAVYDKVEVSGYLPREVWGRGGVSGGRLAGRGEGMGVGWEGGVQVGLERRGSVTRSSAEEGRT